MKLMVLKLIALLPSIYIFKSNFVLFLECCLKIEIANVLTLSVSRMLFKDTDTKPTHPISFYNVV